MVVIGAGIVGQLRGRPPRRARLARHRADRQGPAAQPGRIDRPRVQLHLPRRSQPRDGARSRSTASASTSAMGVNVTCGGIEIAREPRAPRGVPAPHDVGQGLGHRGRAAHARRGAGARARSSTSRSSSAASTRRASPSSTRCRRARSSASGRRQAARCQTVANVEVLGIETSTAAASRPSSPTRAASRREYVVIACGVWSPRIAAMAGATHPAHARRAPDDRRRTDPRARGDRQRDRLPDRPRHGHVLYERQTGGSMEVGSYAHRPIFHRRRRHPVDQGVAPVADRAAVHRRRLRPAARRGARADARHPRHRRDQVRDQRAAVAHPRRLPAARRDARGPQPVVGGRGVDQGRAGRRRA